MQSERSDLSALEREIYTRYLQEIAVIKEMIQGRFADRLLRESGGSFEHDESSSSSSSGYTTSSVNSSSGGSSDNKPRGEYKHSWYYYTNSTRTPSNHHSEDRFSGSNVSTGCTTPQPVATDIYFFNAATGVFVFGGNVNDFQAPPPLLPAAPELYGMIMPPEVPASPGDSQRPSPGHTLRDNLSEIDAASITGSWSPPPAADDLSNNMGGIPTGTRSEKFGERSLGNDRIPITPDNDFFDPDNLNASDFFEFLEEIHSRESATSESRPGSSSQESDLPGGVTIGSGVVGASSGMVPGGSDKSSGSGSESSESGSKGGSDGAGAPGPSQRSDSPSSDSEKSQTAPGNNFAGNDLQSGIVYNGYQARGFKFAASYCDSGENPCYTPTDSRETATKSTPFGSLNRPSSDGTGSTTGYDRASSKSTIPSNFPT